MITLFSKGFLEKQTAKLEIENFEKKKELVKNWCESITKTKKENETSIKSSFNTLVFNDILGYKSFGSEGDKYSFKDEWKVKGIGKADFVLGEINNNIVEVVGELKGLNADLDKYQKSRTDMKSPVEQGLNYLENLGEESKFLIVSNLNEIRFYKRGIRNKYEVFYFSLTKEQKELGYKDLTDEKELKKFIFILCKENLLSNGQTESNTEKVLRTQSDEEKQLEKKFYGEYKQLREKVFFTLLKTNPEYEKDKNKLLSLTQKFLDRIIFCWFCEDSREQLLPPDVLGNLIKEQRKSEYYDKNGCSIYGRVKELFKAINIGNTSFKIDKGYNGGLFKDDKELNKLNITNEIFEVIGELSEYDFGNDEILNVNVLGHIFEQSISDLEELRAGFEGEEYDIKKSKRKKEGVYYTPEYITRYIVENTVGKWLNDRMEEIKKENARLRKNKEYKILKEYQKALQNIKILDPACGSGAFLVQAFDYLLEENRKVINMLNDLIIEENIDNGQVIIFDTDKFVKDILQNNLYGVDLNSESVEITKLSLWLKTAERDKQLASLDDSIKCGNSLIDDETIAGDKAFKWEKEFKSVMDKGGFDCVIGNPPYGATISKIEHEYFTSKYNTAYYKLDSFGLFIEKSILLLNNSGLFGYIVPYTWTRINQHKKLREFIISFNLISIVFLPVKIFEDADLDTVILILKKDKQDNLINICDITKNEITISDRIPKHSICSTENFVINLNYNTSDNIISKIKSECIELQELCEISQGYIPYDKYRGHTKEQIKNRVWHSNIKKTSEYKPELKGEDIKRYFFKWCGNLYIKYGNWLAATREQKFFLKPRILIREITRGNIYKLSCCYVEGEYYNTPSIINIINKNENVNVLLYILSLINSKLMTYYHLIVNPKAIADKSIPKILVIDVKKLPIKNISTEQQKPFIEKANMMLSLNKSLNEQKETFFEWIQNAFNVTKLTQKLQKFEDLDKEEFTAELRKAGINVNNMEIFNQCIDIFKKVKAVKEQIDKTDKEIDGMVFDLYGLTKEERQIINETV